MFNILIYIFLFVLSWRFLRFITTPLLKFLGIYEYHSPLFMTVKVGPKLYELHLGTSWDFIFRSKFNSITSKLNVLEGLLILCDKIEKEKFPKNVILRGNPYFLKSSSLSRFGFKERKLNPLEYFMTLLSFLESTILLSISRKKLLFANINNNRIIYINSSDLLRNKPLIKLLRDRMLHQTDNKVVPFVETNEIKVNAS